MKLPGRILIVEDDEGLGLVLLGLLSQAGFQAEHVLTAEAGLSKLDAEPFDAVLTDLRLPGLDGMGLLHRIQASGIGVPVLMLTAHASVPVAVSAMQNGAVDFLQKPFDREEILFALDKAIRGNAARSTVAPTLPPAESGLLGECEPMKVCAADISRAARVTATVLLRGETGTGKEVAARSIHRSSDRRDKTFIAVHCGALPEQLLESELFGYHKGAFTGATQNKPGRVALAEGGTLFLDEIGDIAPSIQVKLLRLLQEKEYQPLGASEAKRADVRFIAATHRDLESMVSKGEFRDDLYYRLNVLPIWLPPLRDRAEDVGLLAQAFLIRLAAANRRGELALAPSALGRLRAHAWPGNVRELENFIERLVVFADGNLIEVADVERELRRRAPGSVGPTAQQEFSPAVAAPTLSAQRDAADRAAIEEALHRCDGNRTRAARLLGISRRTLYTRLGDLGLGEAN
jgi:DNA-binding NtrC family response regulator